MCGITGFIDYKKRAGEDDLRAINNLLGHRGPDDSGCYFKEHQDFNVGLGHRRLSILDLSSSGHQPMQFKDLSISFNGEIYNFQEIRHELVGLGYEFTTQTDTEVILKSFYQWGLDSVERFNGMFAIAIFNTTTHDLWLIRDRIGVKPLYYYYHDQTLVFASELKSIINYPDFKKEIDFEALGMFLYHGYITAPFSIFKNVRKLNPGTWLKAFNGKIETGSYWNLEEKFKNRQVRDISENEALQELDELITSSVKYRMISDAPVGAFLSGGYDSSLVTAIMQKESKNPIKTFTIGFENKRFNEAEHAGQVAKHLGTDHHELYLPVSKVSDLILKIPTYFDEPFADSSQLPTMLVSEFARKEVTVILSGDGGDELFCGYTNYDLDVFYQRYIGVGKALYALNNVFPVEKLARYINKKYDKYFYLNNSQHIINLGYIRSRHYLEGLIEKHSFSYNNKYFELAQLSGNIQEAHMLQDMLTYLPDDIMVKVDRATMSASLEGREPLLDYRLFEYALNLPHKLKCNGDEKKYLLKKLAHTYIPEELLNRPKAGFAAPMNHWLKNDIKYLLKDYLSEEYLEKQGLFNVGKVKYLLRNFQNETHNGMATRIVWHLIVFQLWYEKYIK